MKQFPKYIFMKDSSIGKSGGVGGIYHLSINAFEHKDKDLFLLKHAYTHYATTIAYLRLIRKS